MNLDRRQRRGNVVAPLPLFAWASEHDQHLSRPSLPALWLRRRFRVDPARAELVANLAGLGRRL